MNDVVITGMGIVSPFGMGLDLHWEQVYQGLSCIDFINRFETDSLKTKFSGLISDDIYKNNLSRVEFNKLDKYTQLSLITIGQCIEDSGLSKEDLIDAGIILGTGFGTMHTLEDLYENEFVHHLPDYPLAIIKAMNNSAASEAAIKYKLTGFNQTVLTACSAGANAIGQAYRHIKDGYSDCMVAGGVDTSITRCIFKAWNKLRVLSTYNEDPKKASRPFCKSRDGFALSEGAGFIMLESKQRAEKRNAHIYAKVSGYASNCDAIHIATPNADQQASAIKDALKDAQLDPSCIDMINAHGTSTQSNDATESKSINMVFGNNKLPVTALKSQFGHTIGASGAIETIMSVLMMNKSKLLPSINFSEEDADCNINLVREMPIKKHINAFVKNSFGFGGNNAVLVFENSN